jgi:hypothetical protein
MPSAVNRERRRIAIKYAGEYYAPTGFRSRNHGLQQQIGRCSAQTARATH